MQKYYYTSSESKPCNIQITRMQPDEIPHSCLINWIDWFWTKTALNTANIPAHHINNTLAQIPMHIETNQGFSMLITGFDPDILTLTKAAIRTICWQAEGVVRWIFALGLVWRPEGFSEGKPEAVGRGFVWGKSQGHSIYPEGTNSPGYPQGFSTDCHSK